MIARSRLAISRRRLEACENRQGQPSTVSGWLSESCICSKGPTSSLQPCYVPNPVPINTLSTRHDLRAIANWHGEVGYVYPQLSRLTSHSNILQLPFRRTHPVNLSAAIKQYISTKYDQHPEMFADDLRLIDELRGDATNVQEAHVSGIKRLTSYAAQLRWIGGKFPIDVGVDFPWYPALGFHTNQPVLQNNLRFELANILFNLAVLYSQLAFATNRTTGDGLKTAAQ